MPRSFNSSSITSNVSYREKSPSDQTDSGQTEFFPVPLIVILSFMCLLIVAVNGLVIFLIYQTKTLRTLTNMFLTSLALSDLMSGLVGVPLLLICLVVNKIEVCVTSTIFIRFTTFSSVCHVLLIAFDSYIFIVRAMEYESLVTKRRAIIAAIAAWLISFKASVIQVSWYSFHEIALTEEMTKDHNKKYSLACTVLFFAVPLLSICFMYGRIFQISLKSNKSNRQLSKNLYHPSRSLLHEWRGRTVLLITVVIFVGCWLPFFLAMLQDHMESSEQSSLPIWVQQVLVFLRFIPPLLNPILCTLAKRDFRHALKGVVLKSKRKETSVEFEVRREKITLNVSRT